MKTKIIIFSILSLLFSGIGAFAESENQLTIPLIEGKLGQEAQIPVYLINENEITGVQVNIHFPQGAVVNTNAVTLSDRKANHTISARSMGNGNYLFVIFSADNQLIKGNSGILFTIPVAIPMDWEEGTTYPLSFNQVILSSVQGDNLVTASDAGAIKIITEPRPDVAVQNIRIDKNAVSPGENVSISWSISNTGNKATESGWSEHVSLIDSFGMKVSLGTLYYEGVLTVGGTVSRQAEFSLPQLVGIDGNAKVSVQIVPDTALGELPSAQGNNIADSEQSLAISKKLFLDIPSYTVSEKNESLIQCKLSRSGSWSNKQVFTLTTSDAQRISLPESVTVPAQQSGTFFYIRLIDNSILDIDSLVSITVEGNGYEAVSGNIAIEDDELAALSLSASQQELNEGDAFSLVIERERIASSDLVVYLSCDPAKRFEFPAQVIIPAGQKSITVNISVKDDNMPDATTDVTLTVTAAKHTTAQQNLVLYDNDIPEIALTVTPETVGESAGLLAVNAVLRRLNHTESNITVRLTDNSNGVLYYSSSQITMAAGVEEVHFTIGIVDDADVNGDREIDITAAVYISSCSCSVSGTNAGVVQAKLTILDDDGPALKITSSQTMLQEGKTNAAILTVTRNTATTESLTVSLSSDHDSELVYEKTVTIPAGSASVQIPVSVLANSVTDGDRTVVFTVTATDYTQGICWVMITDQTLPDAVISKITLSVTEVEAEGKANLQIVVTNNGAATLSTDIPVNIYLSNSENMLTAYYTKKTLAINESDTITQQLTFPNLTGDYTLYAVINESQSVKELLYLNNKSETIPVKLLPKFTATVTTDKTTYKQGEPIAITGQLSGSQITNVEVEVYLINSGIRQTLKATTDVSGHFQTTFQPSAYQSGHFILGACYPNEGLSVQQATVDIYGVKRGNSGYITHDLTVNESYQGNIPLVNTGTLTLHNVKAEIISAPDNCTITFDLISSIDGNETKTLNYTLTGNAVSEGNDWQQLKIRITGDESDLLELTIYAYFRSATGKLTASLSSIRTTMTKGASRDYPFTITNTGKGATGKISLSLPANATWLSSATPREMASLEPNESANIVLRFTPTDNLALNVPVTGTIGINCENGEGLPLAFSIEPVSELTGTLVVDVCDEYTYYTAEAPHLAGAKVVVKHPVTEALIREGFTDENGLFTVSDLQEGYYAIEVSAEKHDKYRNNILIDPGKENKKVINLSFQAITYSWEVVETEVEDKYEIVTTVKYETNVPTPVVEVVFPKTLEFEDQIFPIYATNKGLIAAQNVIIQFPELEEITFELLSQNPIPSLAPQQSVVFYVKMTINEPSQRIAGPHHIIGCIAGAIGLYYTWYCGLEEKLGSAMANYAWGECSSIFPWFSGGGGSGGNGPGMPNGGGGGSYEPSSNGNYPTIVRDCSDCDNEFKLKLADCVLGCIPYVGCAWGVGRCGYGALTGNTAKQNIYCIITSIGGCIPVFGCAVSIASCLRGLLDPCDYLLRSGKLRNNLEVTNNYSSYILNFQEKIKPAYDGYLEIQKLTKEFFGDDTWFECDKSELDLFYSQFLALNPLENAFDNNDLVPYKPSNISMEVLTNFVNRWNNTRRFIDNEVVEGDVINLSYINELMGTIKSYENRAIEYGYDSMSDLIETEMANLQEWLDDEASSSVCASISLQFSQTMTMTRQAFRGTLTVFNGHESIPMENVRLNLVVKDEQGNTATSHEFQINNESLKDFGGELNGAWSLDAQKTGVATIVFIPTKYAAPDVSLNYSFGGTLSYIDPFTGLEVTRDLYPVTLTVKPSPNLDLTYFMQRDVLGDDPLTPEIEPVLPAEFSLLIHNVGVGDATDLRMVTQQPEIVDNQKGLFIDFELLSSQLNGGEHTLALGGSVPTEFGTISGGKTAYAQWWFTGSLLGHFTEYDVKATHITSYGNPDLTLLNEVTIHELIHSIRIPGSGSSFLTGFVVNDIADAEDLPDMLYLSDGVKEPIAHAANVAMNMNSNSQYTLTVTPSSQGWNYGSINDPTNGRQQLIEIKRLSDDASIDLHNFRQTDRTLRDGKDPLYENKLHFIDKFGAGSEQYLLTFTPRPDVFLEIEAFEGAPETVSETPVSEIKVKFNKNIDETTFTTEDIHLICQGNNVDASSIAITKITDNEFRMDLSSLTQNDGYYVLTVQTAGISDDEGYTGKTGKSVDWNQYLGGQMQFNLKIEPENGGTVTPVSGKYKYGSLLHLNAVPDEGYEFEKWSMNGEELSTNTNYDFTLLSNNTLTASFKLKLFDVAINYDSSAGTVTGSGTGKYEYGTKLILRAEPLTNYVFESWQVDGETIDTPVLEITVLANTTIEAVFASVAPADRTTLNYNLSENWNWISFNTQGDIQPATFLNPVLSKVNRIISADSEAAYNPESGLSGTLTSLNALNAYKLKMNETGSLSWEGYACPVTTTPIELSAGWNWIGYLPTVELTPDIALSNVSAITNEVIKNQTDFSVFDGQKWQGTLTELKPGEGYSYHAASAKSFTYSPVRAGQVTAPVLKMSQATTWEYNAHRYRDNMNIIARLSVEGQTPEAGIYTVGAFCGDECRGIGQYVDGRLFITVHGENAEDVIRFKAYENAAETERDINETMLFSDALKGTLDQPVTLSIKSLSLPDNPDPSAFVIYPSPVRDKLYIAGLNGEMIKSIKILTVTGSIILATDSYNKGEGINVSALSDGNYLLAIGLEDGVIYRKFIKSSFQ